KENFEKTVQNLPESKKKIVQKSAAEQFKKNASTVGKGGFARWMLAGLAQTLKNMSPEKTSEISETKSEKNTNSNLKEKIKNFRAEVTKALKLTGKKISPKNLINIARGLKGTNYVLGGESKNGIDCSGLIMYAANKSNVATGDTTAAGLESISTPVKEEAGKPGDCIFWREKNGKISHIAIITEKNTDGTYKTIESAKRFGGVGEDPSVDLNTGTQKTIGRLPFIS
ncbi:C40 family peptidase, partial [bacterium]|nr:C40 family peptidase [bacterium]